MKKTHAFFPSHVAYNIQTCDEVFVTTGPLYLPAFDRNWNKNERVAISSNDSSGSDGGQRAGRWRMSYPLIGEPPSLVAVPTHFYKVILAEQSSKRNTNNSQEKRTYSVAAFVIPNAYIDPATPLASFLVPIDALESVAGVKFHKYLINESTVLKLNERTNRLKGSPINGSLSGNIAMIPRSGLNHHASLSKITSSPIVGELNHLCDMVACELVSQEWLKSFSQEDKKQPNIHNKHHVTHKIV